MKCTLVNSVLALAAVIILLTCSATAKGEPQYTDQQVPYFTDGEHATLAHLRDLNGYRYMEFFLVGSEPVDGKIMGTCYNTTGRNTTPADPKDSCPEALVKKLDPAELAQKYHVPRVYINPPRQWLLDSIDIPGGAERDFGGIKARWCAVMAMPKGEWKPYTSTTIERKSKFGFNKGQTVYLLDDPEGNTWIMKSFTQAVNPQNTYANLSTIGSRMKMPAGWKLRTTVLDRELILLPESGVARILRDDLDSVYDLTGKGYSNYLP